MQSRKKNLKHNLGIILILINDTIKIRYLENVQNIHSYIDLIDVYYCYANKLWYT